jgi:hypothetical protein
VPTRPRKRASARKAVAAKKAVTATKTGAAKKAVTATKTGAAKKAVTATKTGTAKKTAARRQRRATLERKIHFFRASLGLTGGGQPRQLQVGTLLPRMGRLRFNSSGVYQNVGEGNVLGVWIDRTQGVGRMRIATIRRTALPMVEENGRLSALAIGQSAGLYEAAHVCFFPNNIVGMELNFYGPRAGRIPGFLVPATGHRAFTLEPLLRQDVTEQLNRLRDLRVMSLRIRPSYSATVAQADASLGAAFTAAANVGNPQTVHVILAPEPNGRQNLGQRALNAVKQIAARSDLRENTEEFLVKGPDNDDRMLPIDLLSDELVVMKRIVRVDSRTRALQDGDAYAAIEEAYQEIQDQLEAAAGVSSAS